MEFEQIVKQLEWLDNQHRKDKQTISALQAKVESLDSSNTTMSKQIKELKKISNAAARVDQFDGMLGNLRTDVTKSIEDLEKKYQRREAESNKRYQAEHEGMQKAIADLLSQGGSEQVKRKFKQQELDNERLLGNLGELRKKVDESLHSFEEMNHNMSMVDEIRRQELKRMADLQGELSTLRKLADEHSEKMLLQADRLNVLDARLTELFTSEAKREKARSDFLEQQESAQIERDRSWRDKYNAFQAEAENLSTQMQSIDETLRNAKRAQDTYQELNTKLERRINEVMELQRLAEDRVRQEWITFKAEDQKRWTGYTLSSEESFRDLRKDVQKLDKIVSTLDELSLTMQDQLHQTTDTTEHQLQELMNIVHQWMTSYERIMGHNKKAAKKTST